MGEKIYFLSHSKENKAIVKEIANKLGLELCWIDEGEIRAGESIFKKIDKGIADSRIFILFWSKYSSKSYWVSEEMSQARIRELRDRGGFRIIVVKLDKTELPNYFAHRFYLDIEEGIGYIVNKIQHVVKDLTPHEVFTGDEILKSSFQNRESEINKLETFSLMDDYSGTLILGMDGMGKTSFVKRATTILFPHLTPIWINLDIVQTPLRLISSFARPLSLNIIDIESVANEPLKFWREKILSDIASSENLYIILDNYSTPRQFDRSQIMEDLLSNIVSDLIKIKKKENPGLIIVSSIKPEFNAQILARIGNITIRKMEEKYMVRALRYHLSRLSVNENNYDRQRFVELAKVLQGYPLALGLAATQISELGFERVINNIETLHKLLIRLAQDLVSNIPLNKNEIKTLILLATAKKSLNDYLIKQIIDGTNNIDSLINKQLIDISGAGYAPHAVVQTYILESMATPEEIIEAHEKLANLFTKEWEDAPDKSAACAEYGSLACYHALAAGKESEAKIIEMAYKEEAKIAAVELYRRGKYDTALKYLENLREMEESMEPILEFYYALCLNRNYQSEEALIIIDSLIKKDSSISRSHHARGSILKTLRRNDEALESFRKAVATSDRKNVVALSSLASQLCKMDKMKEALRYAKEAFNRDPTDSQVISILVDIHHQMGDDLKALNILNEALKKRKTDKRLNARAGIIAKGLGKLTEAISYLNIAIEEPKIPHAIIALADVYIELGNYEKAESILNRFPYKHYKEVGYWITKANLLRHTKKYDNALICIKKALEIDDRNTFIYRT